MGAKKEARRETSCPVTHSVHRILPLPACACLQELEDCEARFRLAAQQFAPEDALSQLSLGGPASGGGAAGARRPQKATPYSLCLRSGLGGWVRGLGLSAAQLADNVEAGYQKHTPVDLQVGWGINSWQQWWSGDLQLRACTWELFLASCPAARPCTVSRQLGRGASAAWPLVALQHAFGHECLPPASASLEFCQRCLCWPSLPSPAH
jgi:hypothetical protein